MALNIALREELISVNLSASDHMAMSKSLVELSMI